MEGKPMKKALFISILSLFLCTSFALATAEQTGGIELSGTVATVKDGFLPASLNIISESYDQGFFSGVVTVKAFKGDKVIYNRTFPCTGYLPESSEGPFIITTTDKAVMSTNYWADVAPSLFLQIPGDGITGKFSATASN
jgi:hypothetical protein